MVAVLRVFGRKKCWKAVESFVFELSFKYLGTAFGEDNWAALRAGKLYHELMIYQEKPVIKTFMTTFSYSCSFDSYASDDEMASLYLELESNSFVDKARWERDRR